MRETNKTATKTIAETQKTGYTAVDTVITGIEEPEDSDQESDGASEHGSMTTQDLDKQVE